MTITQNTADRTTCLLASLLNMAAGAVWYSYLWLAGGRNSLADWLTSIIVNSYQSPARSSLTRTGLTESSLSALSRKKARKPKSQKKKPENIQKRSRALSDDGDRLRDAESCSSMQLHVSIITATEKRRQSGRPLCQLQQVKSQKPDQERAGIHPTGVQHNTKSSSISKQIELVRNHCGRHRALSKRRGSGSKL